MYEVNLHTFGKFKLLFRGFITCQLKLGTYRMFCLIFRLSNKLQRDNIGGYLPVFCYTVKETFVS